MTSTDLNKPDLASVTTAFEHWRQHSEKRQRIPNALREQVVSLVGHYPKNRIAKALHINHAMINRWLGETCSSSEPSKASTTGDFVPLPLAASNTTAPHIESAHIPLLTMTHASGWCLQWHTLPDAQQLNDILSGIQQISGGVQ